MSDQKDKSEIAEAFKLSTTGKLFIAGMAAWVMGRPTHLKVRGTQDEIRAISNSLKSSRRFREELNREGATVESVIEKLNLKNASAAEFERILKVPWPL